MVALAKPYNSQGREPAIEIDPADGQEYYVYDEVPVFDEHEDDEGVVYDKKLLEKIASNNNSRIEDTGDYCPIVEWHTPEDKDPEKDPPIAGFAGPFTVKRFGKKKPRWAIYARFRIRRDKHDVFRNRPRRSVEIWPEDCPENRYIDPIALLGAETPRRDLGIITYSKSDRSGNRKLRYEMAATSGTNTFAPSFGDDDNAQDEPRRNQKSTMPLTREDIAQLLEAFTPAIEQIVDEKLVGLGGKQGDLASGDGLPPADPMADPAAAGGLPGAPGGAPPAPPAPGIDNPAAAGAPPMGDAGGDAGEPPQDDLDDEPKDLDDDEKQYGKAVAARFMKRYSKDGADSGDEAIKYLDGMNPDDRKTLDRYMKQACDDPEAKEFYAKCCSCRGGQPTRNSKSHATASAPSQYAKIVAERDAIKAKYAKAVVELDELRAAKDAQDKQAAAARKKARYAKRHATLAELVSVEGVILDPDEEMAECESMTESQFDNHVARCRMRYQKAPIGQGIEGLLEGPKRYAAPDESDKYARAARDIVLEARNKGEHLEFDTVLRYMKSNRTTKYTKGGPVAA